MEKNFQRFLRSLILGGVFFISMIGVHGCDTLEPTNEFTNDVVTNVITKSFIANEEFTNKMIILGKRLENPYSVENMQKALQLVIQSKDSRVATSFQIEPTHYYVRFLPKSDEELDLLKRDLSLELFNYPIDVEMIRGGSYYHDPSIPEGEITWQYTSVAVDFLFPDIRYEIIEDLFLSQEEGPVYNDIYYREVEIASLKLTDNYDSTLYDEIATRGSWYPSGKICAWDDYIGAYIPLEGVKVRATSWFKYLTVYTNQTGEFVTGLFTCPVSYKIIWETSNYDIRSGFFGQATLEREGGNHTTPWILNIPGATIQNAYASVHRGIYRYFFKNIDGLRRPGYTQSLKYSVYDKEGNALGMNWPNIDPFGIFPDVEIWAKYSWGYRPSNGILSTAIHETAHASHRKYITGIQFAKVSSLIVESWARAVQWRLTQIEYAEREFSNYDIPPWSDYEARHLQSYARSFYPNSDLIYYSPLFIDLIDSYNQALLHPNASYFTLPYDDVTGYTLAGIEANILGNVKNLSELRIRLKMFKPVGVSDQQIDTLLDYYLGL